MTEQEKPQTLAESDEQLAIPYATQEGWQKDFKEHIDAQVRKEEIKQAVSDTTKNLESRFATKDSLKGYISYPWFLGIIGAILLGSGTLYYFITNMLIENALSHHEKIISNSEPTLINNVPK